MDKLIKLPAMAIENIVKTRKNVVFLSHFPTDYKPTRDRLILVEEETGDVLGVMRAPVVIRYKSFLKPYLKLRKGLAYKDRSIWNYLFNPKPFYAFIFTDYVRFKDKKKRREKAVQ